MKKIMFNDQYGLTKAVLEGRKTQTRRILTVDMVNRTDLKCLLEGNYKCCLDKDDKYVDIRRMGNYQVGEVVAIAQSYKSIMEEDSQRGVMGHPTVLEQNASDTAGWGNKMFVKARSMPHHIRITNVRIERLQDISDEDCIAEGITHETGCGNGDEVDVYQVYTKDYFAHTFYSARYAYADLINRISGCKNMWDSNPFVFVYEFELIK